MTDTMTETVTVTSREAWLIHEALESAMNEAREKKHHDLALRLMQLSDRFKATGLHLVYWE